MKRRAWVVIGILVVTGVIGFCIDRFADEYYVHVLDIMFINVLLALGLNFILGFGGQISLAQAAFFGMGAYSFSILEVHGVPSIIAAIVAIVLTGLVGLILGWPALRLKGHYLALATLAFAVIMEELFINLDSLTGGSSGLLNIPGFHIHNPDRGMFYILLVIAAIGVGGSVLFSQSPVGLRVRAFRDDSIAAEAIGISTTSAKVLLFIISAVYAGLAGILYSSLLGYISPDVFAWQTTFNYLAMVVVGGLGSTLGAVIGAAIYTLLPEWLRFLQEAYFAVFGLLVIVVITSVPGGVAGLLERGWRHLFRLNDSQNGASKRGKGAVATSPQAGTDRGAE